MSVAPSVGEMVGGALITSRGVAVGLVLAVSMSVTACAGMGGEAMMKDPDLTKQVAITQTLKHLKRTEASLPERMVLSSNSDVPGAVKRERPRSGSMPCGGLGADDLETSLQLVYMSYFVTGVPEGQNKKYLTTISRLWESWGWTPTREPNDEWAAYANEDGYTLSVRDASVKPGTIYITAETPCIAAENFNGSDEVPQKIGSAGS